MTEYDAFGNPIEPREAATGATATPVSATPTPTPSPPATPLLTALPDYGPSKPSWGGRAVGLLILLSFVAPLGVGAYFAFHAFHTATDAVDTVVTTARGFAPATATPSGEGGGAKAKPGASMLHASTLRQALAAAQRDPGGRLTLLRVEADRADLQLARKGGGLTLVQLRADGGRSVIEAPGTPSRTIGFARVDVRAPARLVRQAAHRLGRSTKSIDYLVLMNFLGGPKWSAYFKGGAAFQGDAHGHVVRRIQ